MKATKCSNRNIDVCIQPRIIFLPPTPCTCDPITGLTCDFSDIDSITMIWNNMDCAISYNVQYRKDGIGGWIEISGITDLLYEFIGLDINTDYEFQIKSICINGLNDWSDSVICSTSCECKTPENIEITDFTTDTISLKWDEVLCATSYEVQWRINGIGSWSRTTGITDLFYDIAGLDSNTEYEVQVRSECDGNFSDWSASIIESTKFDPISLSPFVWLKYDAGITKDGSNYVSQWDDQSGNDNHFPQPIGASQPRFDAVNGVYFDGINDYMSALLPTPSSFTLFIVFEATRIGGADLMGAIPSTYDITKTWGGATIRSSINAGGNYNAYYWLGDNYNYSYGALDELVLFANHTYTYTNEYTNGDNYVDCFINNNKKTFLKVATGATSLYCTSKYSIGRFGEYPAHNFEGYIKEVILYYSALSSSNRQLVEIYLKNKYGHY